MVKRVNTLDLEKFIDYTLLKPDASRNGIKKLCREAVKYGFYSVCVSQIWVKFAKKLLHGSGVKIGTVVGFPLGTSQSVIKVLEATRAKLDGADELDMVMNIGAFKSGDYKLVEDEIKFVVEVAGRDTPVKVIIETAYLNDREKIRACRIVKRAGASFVKTSTGFGGISGATVHDVKLMRKTVGKGIGVKAAGGIRDRATAIAMIKAGANRIGTSTGIEIVTGR